MNYLSFIQENIDLLKKYGFIKPDGSPISDSEAKALYKKLARQNHPDLHPGDKNKYEDIMKDINSANDEFKKRRQTNNWKDKPKSDPFWKGYNDAEQSRKGKNVSDIWDEVKEEDAKRQKERDKKYEKKYKFTEKDKKKYGDISEKLRRKKNFYNDASIASAGAGYIAGSGFLLNAARYKSIDPYMRGIIKKEYGKYVKKCKAKNKQPMDFNKFRNSRFVMNLILSAGSYGAGYAGYKHLNKKYNKVDKDYRDLQFGL